MGLRRRPRSQCRRPRCCPESTAAGGRAVPVRRHRVRRQRPWPTGLTHRSARPDERSGRMRGATAHRPAPDRPARAGPRHPVPAGRPGLPGAGRRPPSAVRRPPVHGHGGGHQLAQGGDRPGRVVFAAGPQHAADHYKHHDHSGGPPGGDRGRHQAQAQQHGGERVTQTAHETARPGGGRHVGSVFSPLSTRSASACSSLSPRGALPRSRKPCNIVRTDSLRAVTP